MFWKRTYDVVEAHKFSRYHKAQLMEGEKCGCFYCLKIFPPAEIEHWTEEGKTALCPYCCVDAVLGENSGYPINEKFLRRMNKKWLANSDSLQAEEYFHPLIQLIKLLFVFLIMVFVTLYKQTTIAGVLKLVIWVLSGLKWLYYVKKNNCKRYFKTSFTCVFLYWSVISVNLFMESKVNTILFMFLSVAVWVTALVWDFRAGSHFLKVINRYDPQVMKTYYSSKDYKNKQKNLETELLRIKESAPEEVVEAIERREMIKPVAYFHLEMLFLTLLALWPSKFS